MPKALHPALALTLLAGALVAQTPAPGQAAAKDLNTWAIAHLNPKFGSGTPELGRIGPKGHGDGSPAQTMEMSYGRVGLTLPTGNIATFGYRFLPLYSDSPAAVFEDFGAEFGQPVPLAPSLALPAHGGQWRHLRERDAFLYLPGGDPTDVGGWITNGFPITGNGAAANLPLIGGAGPVPIFESVRPLAEVPPTSPSGGALIGLNMVLQASVLDSNGSTLNDPKLRMSNAIGLRAMIGPPIKIDLGSGQSNYAPRGVGTIGFRGERITPTIGTFVLAGGEAISLPTTQIDGSRFDVHLSIDAESGPLVFRSASGPGRTRAERLLVVTQGPAQGIVSGQLPVLHATTEDGGDVWGFTVVGSADQIGSVVNLVPPALLALFDLEIAIYNYDPLTDRAGYGATVPIAVSVSDVAPSSDGTGGPGDGGGSTVVSAYAPAAPPVVAPLGQTGSVLRASWEDLATDVAIEVTSTTASPQQFLAVVRARAAN